MILVIDNYDSFTYNLVHYLQELDVEVCVIRNDDMDAQSALSKGANGIVLSPGPCTPNEAGICMDIVKIADDNLPILGVCLGHQSIGQALGAQVAAAQAIMHGKVSVVRHFGGELFHEIPETFDAVRYHSLAVLRDGLPNSIRVDAETSDGEIMALSHATRPLFGVQFHPESIGSSFGKTMLKNFLKRTGDA